MWFCSDGDQICLDADECVGHDICEEDGCEEPQFAAIDGDVVCEMHSGQRHRLLLFKAQRDVSVIAQHVCSACGA